MLGEEHYKLAQVIARQAEEDTDTAATRVWSATECLKKSGGSIDAPLTFDSVRREGCVLLASGEFIIATFAVRIKDTQSQHALAVLSGGEGAASYRIA
jgi:enediyne polyketide synthase